MTILANPIARVLAAAAMVLGGAHLAGVRVQLAKPAPIEIWLAQLRSGAPKALPVPAAPGAAVRSLDTALLPLVANTLPVGPIGGFAAIDGGGIALAGRDVVIADARGAFAVWQASSNAIRKLTLPPLPNAIEAYAAHLAASKETITPGFRVHDITATVAGDQITLYAAHETFLTEPKATALRISQIALTPATMEPLGPWETVFTSQPLRAERYYGIGAGGRMLAEPGRLLLTVGDYGQDDVWMRSALEAQNTGSDFGKIISIDLATKVATRISLGHRNPQGLLRTAGGVLYATEHGPKGGDALNRIEPGGNYGWPLRTYGTDYTSYDWPPAKAATAAQAATFSGPLFAFVPSIGISNAIETRAFHPAWAGDLLVASLKARALYRLRLDEGGHVVYSEPIPIGERIRDLAELPDGRIVLWTDAGKLIVLSGDTAKLATNTRLAAPVDARELQPCWACHHIGPTQPGQTAPTLSKVFGRKIGADTFEGYSDALKGKGGTWSEDDLIAYLTDPSGFAPGTAMSYRAASAADAAKIVKRLRTLD